MPQGRIFPFNAVCLKEPPMLEMAAMGAGLSWASGIRLYLAVLVAGLLARFGVMHLPDSLQVLTSNWVIGAAAVLALAEFLADKIPAFDSVWDAIHTFIRIPAGALLAAGAFGDMGAEWMTVAALIGGSLAGASHAAKAGSRALINTSPEPFTNWGASFAEDVAVPGGLLLAFFAPALFLVLLVLFLILAAWLLPKLWRGVKKLYTTVMQRP
jgi:hypothetical protein